MSALATLRNSCSVPAARRPPLPKTLFLAAGCLFVGLLAGCATSGVSNESSDASPAPAESTFSTGSVLGTILMYLPNRALDLFDPIRLRARVGPGFAASARATKPLSATVGSYFSVWAGLPGPRGGALLPIPGGVEAFQGAQASVAEVGATQGNGTPNYSPTEVGVGVHLLLVGLDVGIDPWELVDFVAGILVLDPVGDDL